MAVTIFGTGCASTPSADIDPALDSGLVLMITDKNGAEREYSNPRILSDNRKPDPVLSASDGSHNVRIPLSTISKVSRPEEDSGNPFKATITLRTGEIRELLVRPAVILGETNLGNAQINMQDVREIVILTEARKASLTTP
jgi:hypothetical protein